MASARFRAHLPCRYLREEGWPCEVYDERRAEGYRLVVFQKVYDAEARGLAGRLRARGVKTVFDLCDNLFHYGLDDPSAVRERSEALRRMIEGVDLVSVSTPTLAGVIREVSGREAVVVDDVVEEPRLSALAGLYHRLAGRPGAAAVPAGAFRVVWYGIAGSSNPPFGMIDLQRVLPSLNALSRELPLSLSVISNSEELFREHARGAAFPVLYHRWSRDSFPYVFRGHDACVIPVNRNPLTVCKTANRVILSLLLGVPVVADRIPSYEEFAPFVLFSDWEESLRAYASDPGLRRRHVEGGRRHIRATYNRGRAVLQWSAIFNTLLGEGARGAPQPKIDVSDAQKS